MAVVVENSTDQVAAALNGGVFPVPADVAADNAAREAKKEGKEPEKAEPKVENPDPAVEAKKAADELDDQEGEDGLTPRQKREFTKAMQATIGKKHRMQKEAEELALSQYNQAQLAEQRAEAVERELAQLRAQLKPAPVEEAKPPKREDFASDEAFEDAKVDFRVDQRLKAKAAEDAQRAQEERQRDTIDKATARIDHAKELMPDFEEVVGSVPDDVVVPNFIMNYLQESEMIGELTYHFAKHPEVLTRLATIGYPKALVEVGKIESTLQPFASQAKAANGAEPSHDNGEKPSTETGSAPSKPRVQAPIIRPLNAGSAAQVEKPESDMNSREALKTWQKKHGVTLTARKRH